MEGEVGVRVRVRGSSDLKVRQRLERRLQRRPLALPAHPVRTAVRAHHLFEKRLCRTAAQLRRLQQRHRAGAVAHAAGRARRHQQPSRIEVAQPNRQEERRAPGKTAGGKRAEE